MTPIQKGSGDIAPDGPARRIELQHVVDGKMAERFREAIAQGEKKEAIREKVRLPLQEGEEGREAHESAHLLTSQAEVTPQAQLTTLAEGEEGSVAAMIVPVRGEIGTERPMAAGKFSASSTLSGPEFSAILSRLYAGSPPSAWTQLTLPGSGWTAHQIIVGRQSDMLAVIVDTDQVAPISPETLDDLRRRLRARGIRSEVVSERRPGLCQNDESLLCDMASQDSI